MSSSPSTILTDGNNDSIPPKKPSRAKRNTACHNCRLSHISCDGARPCNNCTRKQKHCFEFDQSLCKPKVRKTKTSKKTASTTSTSTSASSSTSTPPAVMSFEEDDIQYELDTTKERLKQTEERLQELERQNELMLNLLKNQHLQGQHNQQHQQQHQHTTLSSRNELSIDLWNPLTDLTKPILIYDASTLYAIGCNEAFRRTGNYDLFSLKNRFDVISTVPQRHQDVWRLTIQWLITAGVKYFQGHALMKFNLNVEQSFKVYCHLSRSFLWVEFEKDDIFTDEWIVNDLRMKETFCVPFNQQMSTLTPAQSFTRLLTLLRTLKEKSVYSDQKEKQELVIEELYNNSLSAITPRNQEAVGISSSYPDPPSGMLPLLGLGPSSGVSPPHQQPQEQQPFLFPMESGSPYFPPVKSEFTSLLDVDNDFEPVIFQLPEASHPTSMNSFTHHNNVNHDPRRYHTQQILDLLDSYTSSGTGGVQFD